MYLENKNMLFKVTSGETENLIQSAINEVDKKNFQLKISLKSDNINTLYESSHQILKLKNTFTIKFNSSIYKTLLFLYYDKSVNFFEAKNKNYLVSFNLEKPIFIEFPLNTNLEQKEIEAELVETLEVLRKKGLNFGFESQSLTQEIISTFLNENYFQKWTHKWNCNLRDYTEILPWSFVDS